MVESLLVEFATVLHDNICQIVQPCYWFRKARRAWKLKAAPTTGPLATVAWLLFFELLEGARRICGLLCRLGDSVSFTRFSSVACLGFVTLGLFAAGGIGGVRGCALGTGMSSSSSASSLGFEEKTSDTRDFGGFSARIGVLEGLAGQVSLAKRDFPVSCCCASLLQRKITATTTRATDAKPVATHPARATVSQPHSRVSADVTLTRGSTAMLLCILEMQV